MKRLCPECKTPQRIRGGRFKIHKRWLQEERYTTAHNVEGDPWCHIPAGIYTYYIEQYCLGSEQKDPRFSTWQIS